MVMTPLSATRLQAFNPQLPTAQQGQAKPLGSTVKSADTLYIPESLTQVAAIPLKSVNPFERPQLAPTPDPIAKPAKETGPVKDFKRRLAITKNTLQRALQGKPVTDQHMAETSMTLRQLGGGYLAGIAALSSGSVLFGMKEVLGALSFFGIGMVAPIALIDGVLKHRTGLDFNQHYITSYNDAERKPLFNDPHYLPLHILPEEQVHQVAERLGVMQVGNDDNQDQLNKQGFGKAVTQRWALWMLAAGGLTPAIASWTSHLLEPVAESPLLKTKVWLQEQAMPLSAAFGNDEHRLAQAKAYTQRIVGSEGNPDSLMATWWRQLGPKLLKKLPIDNVTPQQNQAARVDAIARHFLKMEDKEREALRQTLNKQSNKLLSLGERLNQGLDRQEAKARGELMQLLEQLPDETPQVGEWLTKLRNPVYRFKLPELAEHFKSLAGLEIEQRESIGKALKPLEGLVGLRQEGFERLMNAMATLANYSHAVDVGEQLKPEWSSINEDARRRLLRPVRDLIDKTDFPTFKELSERFLEQPVQRLFGQMHFEPVDQLMKQFHGEGAPTWRQYVKQITLSADNLKQRYKTAYQLFGRAPTDHLLETIGETRLKTLWRQNVGLATLTLLLGTTSAAALWAGKTAPDIEGAERLNQLLLAKSRQPNDLPNPDFNAAALSDALPPPTELNVYPPNSNATPSVPLKAWPQALQPLTATAPTSRTTSPFLQGGQAYVTS